MTKLNKLLLFLILVTSCGSSDAQIKHNYHEIKDRIVNWNQIFELTDEHYLIYFYSERCGYCNDIKQEVLNYYFIHLNAFYFVCTDLECKTGPVKDLTGTNNIDDFYIFGTPFLIEFNFQTVTNYYVGKDDILSFISI